MHLIKFVLKTMVFIIPYSLSLSAEYGFTYINGNTLLQRINGLDVENTFALGYVVGAYDAYAQEQTWDNQKHYICMPQSVETGQMLDIVKKYLNDNPSIRHFAAGGSVLTALSISFPCN